MIDENEPVADRIKTLFSRLRQETVDQDDGAVNVPEEIIEAFVDHIIVHESSFDWYLRCTGKEEWDELICSGMSDETDRRIRRLRRVYYGYILEGKQQKASGDEVFEDIHEKEVRTMVIMTFVVTKGQADRF